MWKFIKEAIEALIKLLTGKEDEPEEKHKDAHDISGAKLHGLRVDIRGWAKSHAVTVNHYGVGKLTVVTEALREWAKGSSYDVAAVCLFLIRKADGTLEGWFYDYIRPNQSGVGRHVPERPRHPMPGHGNYPTFGAEDDVYILIAGLSRDARRNKSLRCPLVPIDGAVVDAIIADNAEIVFSDELPEFMKPGFMLE